MPADRRAATEAELALAHRARAIAKVRSGDLARRQRALLSSLAAAHGDHAAALSSAQPDLPTTVVKGSAHRVLTELAAQERTVARRWRRRAVRANGLDALLWASMSLAATAYAGAVVDDTPPRTSTLRERTAVVELSDTAATQELVRQLHAVVWGYQLAIGKLHVSSHEHDRAVHDLQRRRVLRDRSVAWLVQRKAEVPAAAAAYVPSVDPTSPRRAGQLVQELNVALEPFCGLAIVAAGTRSRRDDAIDNLTDVVTTAAKWGAPLSAWPGYS